jgi:hypothetical protein
VHPARAIANFGKRLPLRLDYIGYLDDSNVTADFNFKQVQTDFRENHIFFKKKRNFWVNS